MNSRWQTTKKAGIPCFNCGKMDTCTVAPDGTAFHCFRDGKTHQTGKAGKRSKKNLNGTDPHVGKAHRKPAKPSSGGGKAFPSADAAIEAAGRSIAGGQKAAVYTYPGDQMRVARFNVGDAGDKEFRPVHLVDGGWKIGDPPGLLVLYHGDEIPPDGTIWITEGEKACDAAGGLGLAVLTSAHGSSSADKSDWTPLAGRDVCILPDNDEPGRKYAGAVAAILANLKPPARVKVVQLPDLPDGGDIVEYIQALPDQSAEVVASSIIALAGTVPWISPAELIEGPVLRCLADIDPKGIQWLWPARVPLGRITLLVGKPGEGKSFLTCDMTARVTTGRPWPDGSDCPIGSVILISGEDDPGDTIRPRLDACGADVRRVHLLSMVRKMKDGKQVETMFTLDDLPALEIALKKIHDCKLIVVDPIGSYLGSETDSHRDNDVRAILAPVAVLAEKYGAAVLVVAHRRKSSGTSADGNAMGSIAFTAIARAAWHLSRDSEDANRRLFLPGKNNLAPEGTGLAFSITGDPPVIAWERDPVQMSADDALAIENAKSGNGPGRPAEQRGNAIGWLRSQLADLDEHPIAGLRHDAEVAGIAWRTVQRASLHLGLIRCRGGFGGNGTWRLPKRDKSDSPPAEIDSGTNGANEEYPQETGVFDVPELSGANGHATIPVADQMPDEIGIGAKTNSGTNDHPENIGMNDESIRKVVRSDLPEAHSCQNDSVGTGDSDEHSDEQPDPNNPILPFGSSDGMRAKQSPEDDPTGYGRTR